MIGGLLVLAVLVWYGCTFAAWVDEPAAGREYRLWRDDDDDRRVDE